MLQNTDTEKSQCVRITIFFKWETPATKYHIYSITKSSLLPLWLVTLHYVLQKRTQLLHEKIQLLEYQSI